MDLRAEFFVQTTTESSVTDSSGPLVTRWPLAARRLGTWTEKRLPEGTAWMRPHEAAASRATAQARNLMAVQPDPRGHEVGDSGEPGLIHDAIHTALSGSWTSLHGLGSILASTHPEVCQPARVHLIWYIALGKVRAGRVGETTKTPAGLLPHASGKRTRQGLAERQSIGMDLLRAQWRWPVGMALCRPIGEGLWEVRTDLPTQRTARVLLCL